MFLNSQENKLVLITDQEVPSFAGHVGIVIAEKPLNNTAGFGSSIVDLDRYYDYQIEVQPSKVKIYVKENQIIFLKNKNITRDQVEAIWSLLRRK